MLATTELGALRRPQAGPVVRRPEAARGACPRAGQAAALLLLDEPLGALDKKLRGAMQLELKRLQHEVGITFVVVTHDQEEALVMADRMAVLKDGRLLQCDTPHAVYERPADRFVADFIGVMNFCRATPRPTACWRRNGARIAGAGSRNALARRGGASLQCGRSASGCSRRLRHRQPHFRHGRGARLSRASTCSCMSART